MSNQDREFTALPALVQITVQTHISMVEAALPRWLVSYCVVGSAALGAFQAGNSDIDFIAVACRSLDETELETLKRIHRQLNNKRLFAGLDGFYLVEGSRADTAGQWESLRFNEGKCHGLQPFDANSPDGWLLQQYGVCAVGQKPEALGLAVDWGILRRGLQENANTYWRRWITHCRHFRSANAIGLYISPAVLEWGVLGITRLYFSLREQDITSKTGAGEYALETVPEQWHAILKEALRRRCADIGPQYNSVVRRRHDALAYMDYMLQQCNLL